MKIEPEKNDKKPLYPVIAVVAVGATLALSSCQQEPPVQILGGVRAERK